MWYSDYRALDPHDYMIHYLNSLNEFIPIFTSSPLCLHMPISPSQVAGNRYQYASKCVHDQFKSHNV